MSAVIGEGLKPFDDQIGSENSHKATGRVAIPAGSENCSHRPNMMAVAEAYRGAMVGTSGWMDPLE
jgi:hypothetical protein